MQIWLPQCITNVCLHVSEYRNTSTLTWWRRTNAQAINHAQSVPAEKDKGSGIANLPICPKKSSLFPKVPQRRGSVELRSAGPSWGKRCSSHQARPTIEKRFLGSPQTSAPRLQLEEAQRPFWSKGVRIGFDHRWSDNWRLTRKSTLNVIQTCKTLKLKVKFLQYVWRARFRNQHFCSFVNRTSLTLTTHIGRRRDTSTINAEGFHLDG